MPRKHEEFDNQKIFYKWFCLQYKKHAGLLFHIPNGQNIGKKNGALLRSIGLVSGVPDMFLAVPKKINNNVVFNGMFIEMKSKKGKLSKNQKAIHDRLISMGYKVVTCWSCDEAISETKEYLNNES